MLKKWVHPVGFDAFFADCAQNTLQCDACMTIKEETQENIYCSGNAKGNGNGMGHGKGKRQDARADEQLQIPYTMRFGSRR